MTLFDGTTRRALIQVALILVLFPYTAAASATETRISSTEHNTDISPTSCYKVHMRYVVPARSNVTLPSHINSLIELYAFEAKYGFAQADLDETPQLALTLVCRCYQAPDLAVNYEYKHAAAHEVSCEEHLEGGVHHVQLSSDREGFCFAASQRVGASGILPPLTPYLLNTNLTSNQPLTADTSYFAADTFSLGPLDYFAVCNRDFLYMKDKGIKISRIETRHKYAETAGTLDPVEPMRNPQLAGLSSLDDSSLLNPNLFQEAHRGSANVTQ